MCIYCEKVKHIIRKLSLIVHFEFLLVNILQNMEKIFSVLSLHSETNSYKNKKKNLLQ